MLTTLQRDERSCCLSSVLISTDFSSFRWSVSVQLIGRASHFVSLSSHVHKFECSHFLWNRRWFSCLCSCVECWPLFTSSPPGPGLWQQRTQICCRSEEWGASEGTSRRLLAMAEALPLCYHGAISKKECEELLGKKNKDGAYLIRASETIQGAMCLCV